jgi:carboxylesterase
MTDTSSPDDRPADGVSADVLPGAEPMSVAGGPAGVLVLHGFTGTPQSMRGLAQAFADAGFTVELPLLPGHGTSLDDMLATRFEDWVEAAEAAYADLASRCDHVVVAGLSMGASLTLWLAAEHPEVAGIVLVNPACPPPGTAAEMIAGLQAFADADVELVDAIGNDIADPEQTELAYGQTPVRALISLFQQGETLAGRLGEINSPVLLLNSPQDHVVDPGHSEHVAASVSGAIERVTLERSYHVATLDYDRDLINERAVEFARRVTG